MASDNFNRANESPISSPWVNVFGNTDLTSNQAVSGPGALAYYTGAANGFSKFTLVSVTGDLGGGPAVHVDGSGNGYVFVEDGGDLVIYRMDSGDLAAAIGTAAGSFSGATTLSLRRSGNVLIAAIDDVDVVTSSTDTTYTGGQDGFSGYFAALTLDNWTNDAPSGGGAVSLRLLLGVG